MTKGACNDVTTLVTGASGFIGSHLLRALVGRGARVIAISRSERPIGGSGIESLRVDLGDVSAVRETISRLKPHFVFHLSSLADGRPDRGLVLPTLNAEVIATVNMLIACSEAGVSRVILPGSLEEPAPDGVPSSPYAAAKAATRSYARMFHALYGLPVVVARIFMTYGPGQPSFKLIPSTLATIACGGRPIVNSPERGVDWIYVSDVVDGLIRMAEVDGVVGQTIDLGSGTLVSIRRLVEMLCAITDCGVEPEVSSAPVRPAERVVVANPQPAARLLGWHPQVSLREGLARTVAAFQREHLPK